MKSDDVIIKKSKIHGKGIFALRDFKKGEIVLHWDTSDRISKEEYDTLSDYEKNRITVHEGIFFRLKPPENCFNHSCEPNTKMGEFCDVAIRDIKKGEEITTNFEAEDRPDAEKMKCNCGSKKCRTWIKF
ncbi:SET domain-containing protein-lysine N-methyltransferase [Candidatus Pacearchaeota archaeon]|nr:SET domain-containing protein-lysine N-methyltransferase [Candidatus Pacearchaeota archaeon]